MSGELRPTEPETPELTILRGEVQKLRDDIAAACLSSDPRLSTAYDITLNSTDERVTVTNREAPLVYDKWSIFGQNGVLCLEEETQRTSLEIDSGSTIRETTTYPLRSNDFVTRTRRLGYPVDYDKDWYDADDPVVYMGKLIDDQTCQFLLQVTEGLRSSVFSMQAPAPERRSTAGSLAAHILARLHRHAA